ncbi:MAG: MurR/RpiR family transcriptional regulator [Deltaproteobacteria bacterium]|nr:MurR/RpiR family transcriptional regulator [Deltaproteobacteria bacterium]
MLEDRLRKRYQFLTKAQKKVAEFFLAQGEDAAFLSISDLAHQVKTSESTIVRFARSIGYKGYPDLQKELQSGIKQKISPPRALQKAIIKERGQNIYSKIFEMDLQNLSTTQEANSKKIIDQAVEEIIKARRIGFTGFRSSHSLAYLLCFFIGQVRKNCDLLDGSLGNLPNQLINYGVGDLLIGISFPRYASATLNILKYGKKAGCRVMVITDNPVSPVGQISDLVLVAGNKSSHYFNSFSSAVTLVNCLVAGVSLRSRHSVEVLKSVNQIVADWKFLLI